MQWAIEPSANQMKDCRNELETTIVCLHGTESAEFNKRLFLNGKI